MTGAHVLHLIDGLNVGGAETLLRDLVSGLLKRGYRVSVGYSTQGRLAHDFEKLDIGLTHLPRISRIDPLLLARMTALIRRDPPQIVHTHLFKSDFHGRLAARLGRTPIVVSTLHNNDDWMRRRCLGRLYGATARFADRLIAVSPDVRAYQLKYSGVAEDKLVTIENGVDIHRFTGQVEAGKKLRQDLGIAPDSLLFGTIGRLKPQKDQRTFLAAAAKIRRKIPDARFLIVGDGPLRAALEKEAERLGLFPAVIFCGLRNDIPAVLAALDVVVLSSLWEGLPVTLLEAMAASRAIVATAVGGVPGVVTHDISALLVPPKKPQALAEACLALRDPHKRRQMAKIAREVVVEKYSLDVMIDRISALYDSLLRSHGLAHLVGAQHGDAP